MNIENFINNNQINELINIKQQGITNKAEPFFKIDNINDSLIKPLKSNSNVKVSGIFKPKTSGSYVLEAKFQYEEGEDVITSAEIMVIKTSLLALVVNGLANEVVSDSLHEVQLLISIRDDFTETILNIEAGKLLPETITIEFKGKHYSLDEFNLLPDSEKKLTKDDEVKIKGTYKANSIEGPDTLGLKVNYKLGEDAASDYLSFDEIEGGFTNVISKEKANVIVTGTVNPQTKKMKLNSEETIEFTFKNLSQKYPATGVEITITSLEKGQSEIKKN